MVAVKFPPTLYIEKVQIQYNKHLISFEAAQNVLRFFFSYSLLPLQTFSRFLTFYHRYLSAIHPCLDLLPVTATKNIDLLLSKRKGKISNIRKKIIF